MKRFALVILLFILSAQVRSSDFTLIKIRDICKNAFEQNHTVEEMNYLLNLDEEEKPLYSAYKGIALMISARNAISPFEKLRYFHRGKSLLEKSIDANDTIVETRYLRYCVQSNIPFFLGYSQNILSDKQFIIERWSLLNDLDLKKRIQDYMINSADVNKDEKKIFLNG